MSVNNVSYLIDSRLRSTGTVQSGNYNFINAGGVGGGTYELLSFQMANNLYNVDTTNQNIFWDEGGGDLTAVIPVGNYTAATLAVTMKVVMDIASGSTFTIAHGADTGLYTFTIAATTFRFKYLTNTTDVARTVTGFNALDGVLAVSQVSDVPIDLNLRKNILIDVAQDSTQNVTLLSGAEFTFTVPLDDTSSFGSLVSYEKAEGYAQRMTLAANMNSLDIALFHGDGAVLTNTAEYKLLIRRLF